MTTNRITASVVAVSTAAAPALPLLVSEHVISAGVAAQIGAYIVSFAAAWHGNTFLSNRDSGPAVTADSPGLVQIGSRGPVTT